MGQTDTLFQLWYSLALPVTQSPARSMLNQKNESRWGRFRPGKFVGAFTSACFETALNTGAKLPKAPVYYTRSFVCVSV